MAHRAVVLMFLLAASPIACGADEDGEDAEAPNDDSVACEELTETQCPRPGSGDSCRRIEGREISQATEGELEFVTCAPAESCGDVTIATCAKNPDTGAIFEFSSDCAPLSWDRSTACLHGIGGSDGLGGRNGN